jgi:hypothetical protein
MGLVWGSVAPVSDVDVDVDVNVDVDVDVYVDVDVGTEEVIEEAALEVVVSGVSCNLSGEG